MKRLYYIDQINTYFVIREKSRLNYEAVKDIDTNHNKGGILCVQLIKLTGYASIKNYPNELRRIVFYDETMNRTIVYLTNNIEVYAEQAALLYKYRWQVELFFKWIKQHLKIKSFWGTTESAVRIRIFSAITAYCMVAIVEQDLQLNRSNYEVLRILSASLLDKTPIKDLFITKDPFDLINDRQLSLIFFSGH